MGGKGTLVIADATGKVIGTQSLGSIPGGLQTVRPPNLPPGSYTYSVEVEGADGKAVAVRTFTEGTVDGVLFESGAVFLRIGGMKVPIDKLTEITP